LRKATISHVMSVRQHETTQLPLDGFSWNLIFEIFRKAVEKTQVPLKCDKNNGYFTWRLMYMYESISLNLFRMRSMSDKSCRKIQNTYFIFNNFFFPRKPCRLWGNVEKCFTAEHATDDNIIRHMRFACWITKATDILTMCNTYYFSPTTVVTWTYLNVTLYVHCLSCKSSLSFPHKTMDQIHEPVDSESDVLLSESDRRQYLLV
jgi:hypothetical protein